jgi:peptidoglycan/xylan/chitin deacetylase (PgdA/CDA1 family)
MHPAKVALATLFDSVGLSGALLRAQAALFRRHIRAVNYHDVPPSLSTAFEKQLEFYSRHFVPVTMDDLRRLATGEWSHDKPGIVLSFDDGLRSHANVCAPLLEKHGFVGWFMVPVGFVETPASEQAEFARQHSIHARDEWGDGRVAMSWDELRELDRRHVIGCHSKDHRRLGDTLSDAELDDEIPEAKRQLEKGLGHEVEVFAWVGGEEASYSRRAAERIRAAGFRFSFMTNHAVFRPGDSMHHIQRSHVEADFPLNLVRFHLSGFMDVMYTPKRRRVNRLTG